MEERKTIYCPRCGRKVMTCNGTEEINPVAKCKKCKKMVVYNVKRKTVALEELPGRTCSSGMRFY